MNTIDTRGQGTCSPLVPAVVALCQAKPGEKLEIVMDDEQAFGDLKECLAELGIGFREVYDGERLSVEFTKA